MVLFLHSRYRTTGGEERVVENLMWLVREHLGEPVELLERDSAALSPARAALGIVGGGLSPREVTAAVRGGGARVVHAHNLQPTFGWHALRAAQNAGARVVLHLHQFRLVCAVGVCFTRGQPCTRCHGRNTLPGVRLDCRGSVGEAVAYGAGLALWQRRTIRHADAVVVPSQFALERLRELGAPLPWDRVHVLAPPLVRFSEGSQAGQGRYALVVSRLAPEKGVDTAIEACRLAGVPLVVAGDGPERDALETQATAGRDGRASLVLSSPDSPSSAPPGVSFVGQVGAARLGDLLAGAAVALVPSRSESFSAAAAEAMAAGVPVVASRVGALPELVDPGGLVEPGDSGELAEAIGRRWGDAAAGVAGLARARALCSPAAVARRLAEIYDGAVAPAGDAGDVP
jgi:glycosyltransferase involved in cell wall biosynthesis